MSTIPTSSEKPTVRWVGDLYAHHSLATVSRELICALASSGEVRFMLAPTDRPPYPPDAVEQMERAGLHAGGNLRERARRGVDVDYDVEVRHHWPPDFTPASPRVPLVIIQPWERGGIPAAWIEPIMRHVDEVWVPTRWVRECYIASGVPEHRVAVVPNGVDTSTFSPSGALYPLSTSRSTKLLFLGGTILRKGADILLDAYCKAFNPADDVCLVVKTFGSDAVYRGGTMDDRFRRAASDPSCPDIEVLDKDITREEVASVYRACDALVHPYRGEGFGLPIAEAMACELPVIVTGYGACLDFCDSSSAYLLPSVIRPISVEGMAPSKAGFWWAEPDGDALVEAMREVALAPANAREKGNAGKERITSGFTWEIAAQIARARLQALASGRSSGHDDISMEMSSLSTINAHAVSAGGVLGTGVFAETLTQRVPPGVPPGVPPSVSPGDFAEMSAGGGDASEATAASSRISSLASVTSKALNHLDGRISDLDSSIRQTNSTVRKIWDQQVILMLAALETAQEEHAATNAHKGTDKGTDMSAWRDDYLDSYLQTGKAPAGKGSGITGNPLVEDLSSQSIWVGKDPRVPDEDPSKHGGANRPMPVLAIGSGSRHILDHLAKRGIPATNIASEESDSIADVGQEDLRQAFASLEPAAWQAIAILEGIERFGVAHMIELISNCRQALARPGILFVEAANPYHLLLDSISDQSFPDQAGDLGLLIPPGALRQIARQAGFTSAEIAHSPQSSRYVLAAR
ncbi:MAG: glycosyltransferase family 4 protein [Acidimicrobiales bacterium]